jgi:hypothetical protein
MPNKHLTLLISALLLGALLASCTGVSALSGDSDRQQTGTQGTDGYPQPDAPVQADNPGASGDPGNPYPPGLLKPGNPGQGRPGSPDDGMRPPANDPNVPEDLPGLEDGPWSPLRSDDQMQRGKSFLDKVEVQVLESYPPKFILVFKGNLPTACHQLRVRMNGPDKKNRIKIDLYSVVKADAICAQVLGPFDASIPLKGLQPGKYTIWVNGEQISEIEVPFTTYP